MSRIRSYREEKAYEKSVLYRQQNIPYGAMYGRVVAYRRSIQQQEEDIDRTRRREAARHLKVKVYEAFMSHPAATPEDFERCWPSIRDEILKEFTLLKVLDVTREMMTETT
jgi:hypothetical protein